MLPGSFINPIRIFWPFSVMFDHKTYSKGGLSHLLGIAQFSAICRPSWIDQVVPYIRNYKIRSKDLKKLLFCLIYGLYITSKFIVKIFEGLVHTIQIHFFSIFHQIIQIFATENWTYFQFLRNIRHCNYWFFFHLKFSIS